MASGAGLQAQDGRGFLDNDADTVESRVTLESINKRKSIHSSIASNYAARWGPVEAFRELVQNWRDAIIKSFDIAEGDFHVVRQENENEILYTATKSGPDQESEANQMCLGYIRWSVQNGAGTVEISNRQTTLEPWHLDMGGTSKRNDTTQAGVHGEGLKVALLVLLRKPQNHAVRCHSGGFSWTFDFTNQRRFVACLTKMSPTAITKAYDRAKNDVTHSRLPIAINPSEDVQFFIGSSTKGRDENGHPTQRDQVTREQFKQWTKAALFLQDIDEGMTIRTKDGDLLIDSDFSGNIYLKGLLLKESSPDRSASRTGKKLKYGYNFANGITNRERESVASADDESRAILAIWNQVLLSNKHLVGKFHGLLNSEEPEYADVARAEVFIHMESRDYLKNYLLEELEGMWFFAVKEKSQNPRFDQILEGLGHRPYELRDSYWNIVRATGFRTAKEEEQKQFLAADTVTIPEDEFSQSVHRLIRAGLESCRLTRGVNVIFVNAGRLELDSFYSEPQRLFKIHQKWLTIKGAKEELGFTSKILMSSLMLNVAKRLLADAITQLSSRHFPHDQPRPRQWYRKQAITEGDQRILENAQIKQDFEYIVKRHKEFDLLKVKWNTNTGLTSESQIAFQFHRESTCAHFKDILITRDIPSHMPCCIRTTNSRPIQTCWEGTFPFGHGTCEVRVKRGEKYFAMLSNKSDRDSFVILSGKPHITEAVDRPTLVLNDGVDTYKLGAEIESLDIMTPRDWFDGTNSIGTKAVVGIPKNSASQKRPASDDDYTGREAKIRRLQ
ncbi:hypothetical protein F5Y04DRAFT_279296 [Hypomontagnella monticulosa]|nr:hypothetical protein F5Y04DRAFT_279296 [Hypomontagnella monticulosa]